VRNPTQEKSGQTIVRVRCTGEDDPRQFEVIVQDPSGTMQYQVSMSEVDFERLGRGRATADECVRAAFLFLLDREPKESILRRFDVSVIGHYFPGFYREFPRYRDM
jgi:hypothetical protein